MPRFTYHQVTTPADLATLISQLPRRYHSPHHPNWSEQLSAGLRGVLIEDDCDEDFEPMHIKWQEIRYWLTGRRCVRIHLFTDDIAFNNDSQTFRSGDDIVSQAYRGFLTLRPFSPSPLGSTILDPRVTVDPSDASALEVTHLNLANYIIDVAGRRLTATGFPWMNQIPHVGVCAHVCLRTLLQHHAAVWQREPAPPLRRLNRALHGRFGLFGAADRGSNLRDIAKHLKSKSVGYVTASTVSQTDDFREELIAYLDSGFPLIAELSHKVHAANIIGFKLRSPEAIPRDFAGAGYTVLVDRLYVSDDNHFPYYHVTMKGIERDYNSYAGSSVSAFVAPTPSLELLPFLAARDALEVLHRKSKGSVASYASVDDSFRRIVLIQLSMLKEHITRCELFYEKEFYETLDSLSGVDYLWVYEVSLLARPRQVAAVFAVDALTGEELTLGLTENGARLSYAGHITEFGETEFLTGASSLPRIATRGSTT